MCLVGAFVLQAVALQQQQQYAPGAAVARDSGANIVLFGPGSTLYLRQGVFQFDYSIQTVYKKKKIPGSICFSYINRLLAENTSAEQVAVCKKPARLGLFSEFDQIGYILDYTY